MNEYVNVGLKRDGGVSVQSGVGSHHNWLCVWVGWHWDNSLSGSLRLSTASAVRIALKWLTWLACRPFVASTAWKWAACWLDAWTSVEIMGWVVSFPRWWRNSHRRIHSCRTFQITFWPGFVCLEFGEVPGEVL